MRVDKRSQIKRARVVLCAVVMMGCSRGEEPIGTQSSGMWYEDEFVQRREEPELSEALQAKWQELGAVLGELISVEEGEAWLGGRYAQFVRGGLYQPAGTKQAWHMPRGLRERLGRLESYAGEVLAWGGGGYAEFAGGGLYRTKEGEMVLLPRGFLGRYEREGGEESLGKLMGAWWGCRVVDHQKVRLAWGEVECEKGKILYLIPDPIERALRQRVGWQEELKRLMPPEEGEERGQLYRLDQGGGVLGWSESGRVSSERRRGRAGAVEEEGRRKEKGEEVFQLLLGSR